MRWAVYYDDGRTFSSEDGAWEDAPSDGVLFVLEKVGERVNVLSGNDHYVMVDGTIAATQDLGPLLRKLGFIKFGRWTSHRRYEDIGRRVTEDAKHMARDPSCRQ